MALKVVIADDEYLLRRELADIVAQYPALELVAECENGISALEAIHIHKPDIVFLDIMMPGIDGLNLVKHIQSDVMPKLVYITAFNHFAVQAFDVEAIDYLLKPICETRFSKTIDRLLAATTDPLSSSSDEFQSICSSGRKSQLIKVIHGQKSLNSPVKMGVNKLANTLIVDNKEPKVELKLQDIAWVDAAGDYMCIHANQKTHILHSTMKALIKHLGPEQFCRIHRSTIVNKSYITKAYPQSKGDYLLELIDGTQLRLSRTYQAVLADIL